MAAAKAVGEQQPLLEPAPPGDAAPVTAPPWQHGGASPWSPFMALGLLSLLCALQGVSWSPFTSVPNLSEREYGFDDAILTWQQNANNIAQACFTPIAAWLINQSDGLRKIMLLSAVLTVLQCAGFGSVTFLRAGLVGTTIAGAICGGATASLTQGGVSLLSAQWFSPANRAKATAVAYASTYFGQCGSYLWYSTIQREPALRFALQFQLVAAGVLWLTCQVAFPSLRIEAKPSVVGALVKPSLVRSDDRLGFVPGLRLIWETPRRTPTILLIVAGALANGEFFGWSSNLPLLLTQASSGDTGHPLAHSFTAHDGNIIAFASLLAYALGGPVAAEISERYFARNLKGVISGCFLVSGLLSLALFLLLPSSFSDGAPAMQSSAVACYWTVLALVALISFAIGGSMPPLLELMAEVAYPASEGITANGVILLTQIACLTIPAILPLLPQAASFQWCNLIVLITMGLCFALTMPIKQVYRRRHAAVEDPGDVTPATYGHIQQSEAWGSSTPA